MDKGLPALWAEGRLVADASLDCKGADMSMGLVSPSPLDPLGVPETKLRQGPLSRAYAFLIGPVEKLLGWPIASVQRVYQSFDQTFNCYIATYRLV